MTHPSLGCDDRELGEVVRLATYGPPPAARRSCPGFGRAWSSSPAATRSATCSIAFGTRIGRRHDAERLGHAVGGQARPKNFRISHGADGLNGHRHGHGTSGGPRVSTLREPARSSMVDGATGRDAALSGR